MKYIILVLLALTSIFMFGCNKEDEATLQKDNEAIVERQEDKSYEMVGYNPLDPEYIKAEAAKKEEAKKKMKIEDIKVGEGPEAKEGDSVLVHYTGKLENGKVFDSSLKRKEPFTVTLGKHQVIEGWEIGLTGMKAGGKRILTIPPELGYGAEATGPIPGNSTLIFEVEMLKIN